MIKGTAAGWMERVRVSTKGGYCITVQFRQRLRQRQKKRQTKPNGSNIYLRYLCHWWFRHIAATLMIEQISRAAYLSDPSSIIGYACHSLTHWLTDCLVYLIDLTCGSWRCQLKTCWGLVRLWSGCLVKILRLKLGRNADIWLKFWISEFDQDLCKNLLLW